MVENECRGRGRMDARGFLGYFAGRQEPLTERIGHLRDVFILQPRPKSCVKSFVIQGFLLSSSRLTKLSRQQTIV